MKTYIFKTSLFHGPKISREIEIPENTNLYKLAEAIVGAYNFDFDHCFGFFSKITESRYFDSERKYELFTDLEDEGIEPTGAGSVKKTKVNEVWQNIGNKMMFLFDYGDNWLFVVELINFRVSSPPPNFLPRSQMRSICTSGRASKAGRAAVIETFLNLAKNIV